MHISRYGDKNKTRFYKKSCDSYPAALLVMTSLGLQVDAQQC